MQEEENKYVVPSVSVDEAKRAIIVHKSYDIDQKLLKEPLRNKYTVDALDVDSFVDLVNEYKEPSSKLFFDDKSIKCIVDFNSKDKAEFCEKRINLGLGVTPFFYTFNKNVGETLGQREFVFLLKSLFMFISDIDGKANDDMDVIELAESLQAVKKFDSVQKNTSSKISLDVEIKSGAKETISIPKTITFTLPVYEADTEVRGEFKCELFVSIDEERFGLKLVCYTAEVSRREVLSKIVSKISERCEGVKAYKASIN